jgi:UDP-N-acetylmuramoyl-L-alanyl-D-glutamate--2,6-diaminopimelate ligase
LVGAFNAYNFLAIYATAILLGENPQDVLAIMSNLQTAEGRFDTIKSANGIVGIVDYAHTPDALENVLSTIANVRNGNETLITVVGCGGDRDKSKRPIMAKIACKMSDKIILTSDNPRTEDPKTILDQMNEGIEQRDKSRVLTILDREEAIRTACMLARSGDIILIAGKGHEKYQEINGVRHYFDDKEKLSNEFGTRYMVNGTRCTTSPPCTLYREPCTKI